MEQVETFRNRSNPGREPHYLNPVLCNVQMSFLFISATVVFSADGAITKTKAKIEKGWLAGK